MNRFSDHCFDLSLSWVNLNNAKVKLIEPYPITQACDVLQRNAMTGKGVAYKAQHAVHADVANGINSAPQPVDAVPGLSRRRGARKRFVDLSRGSACERIMRADVIE